MNVFIPDRQAPNSVTGVSAPNNKEGFFKIENYVLKERAVVTHT